MRHTIAAIRSGTDPVGPLPTASFHRWLEDPVYCPKCDASYQLVADYDWAVTKYFQDESRRHFAVLRKAITQGHSDGHHITHFETNGVALTRHNPPESTKPLEMIPPMTKLIN
jgi:hypothetical protein